MSTCHPQGFQVDFGPLVPEHGTLLRRLLRSVVCSHKEHLFICINYLQGAAVGINKMGIWVASDCQKYSIFNEVADNVDKYS